MAEPQGEHIFDVLFKMGYHKGVVGAVSDIGNSPLVNVIFPNGEAMFNWFKGFSENSLKGLSILSTITPKSPFNGPGKIPGLFGSVFNGRGRG